MKRKGSSITGPFLFTVPATFAPEKRRRNRQAHYLRRAPGYRSADRCYNLLEGLMRAFRRGGGLSPRQQRELGVASTAEFIWKLRRHFRRLMRFYGVKRVRDLIEHYGKRRGCWQFHHHETPYRVKPDDEKTLLERCHVSNIEPVTWQENMDHRYARAVETIGDWFPGI
jgi:hypothetical protein